MAKRKPTLYNKILKEFTKENNKLPEDRKLSIQQRREIIKNKILPLYKDVPKSKYLGLKKLRSVIRKESALFPPKELCDLNFIDTSEYAYVEWFSLDETIKELVPDCIYVKVTAGDFGNTRVFNTRNYEYSRNGVRNIVERIRPDAENSSGKYIFSGYQKLRKGKKNDGTPENYYLDFVLFLVDNNGEQQALGNIESVRFKLPKTREVQKKKTKIKHFIEAKIKLLKTKRDSKRRAKKTLEKNIGLLTIKVKKVKRSKKSSPNARADARKQFLITSKLLEKYYAEGKLTKYQYEKALADMFKEMGK